MHQLAIVIPYYKINFFEDTLKSIALQTDKRFTLYIGNDASKNDPLPLIKKYFSETEFQYFDYKDNLGGKNLVLQWERILENVQEDWFQILGDDDMISQNFVEEFYNSFPILEAQKITAIKFTHDWIDEENNLIESFNYKQDYLESVDFIIKKHKGEIRSSLSENIFATKMWKKFRFQEIPLAWGSDDLALLHFSGHGKIAYKQNTKVLVRISTSSISGSSDFDREKDFATNVFREKIILQSATYFPKSFINQIIDEYLYKAHAQKFSAKYAVSFSVLKNKGIVLFLKTVRRIFYMNKMKQK